MDVPGAALSGYTDALAGALAFFDAVAIPLRITYMTSAVAFSLALALAFFIWRIVKGGIR